MRNGRRNQLVRIRREEETGRSDINEPVVDIKTFGEAFAFIQDRRGTEGFDAGQRYSETETRFEFDYFDVEGVDESYQLLYPIVNGDVYNIKNILRDHLRMESALIVAVRQG